MRIIDWSSDVCSSDLVSKSGTNDIHGSLYWGNFNSAWSARRWSDTTDPAFTNHNMFALNGGGPVFIPKFYDGRNRTFWFASYSGARYRVGGRSNQIGRASGRERACQDW